MVLQGGPLAHRLPAEISSQPPVGQAVQEALQGRGQGLRGRTGRGGARLSRTQGDVWEEVAFLVVRPREPKHLAGTEDPGIAQQNRGRPEAAPWPRRVLAWLRCPKLSWAWGSHQRAGAFAPILSRWHRGGGSTHGARPAPGGHHCGQCCSRLRCPIGAPHPLHLHCQQGQTSRCTAQGRALYLL